MDFGKSITIAFKHSGMTKVDLAGKMGFTERRLNALMRQRFASLETLERMARIFGMKPSELLALGE